MKLRHRQTGNTLDITMADLVELSCRNHAILTGTDALSHIDAHVRRLEEIVGRLLDHCVLMDQTALEISGITTWELVPPPDPPPDEEEPANG